MMVPFPHILMNSRLIFLLTHDTRILGIDGVFSVVLYLILLSPCDFHSVYGHHNCWVMFLWLLTTGLEAMQLLLCLNLRNNRFSSFTALEPLRSIKSLKVLDVSHNEIGSNSIDKTRYLCSSPLSHKMGTDWNVGDYTTDHVKLVNCWEAVLIFKDLHLAQLDIVGNTVCDENFRMLLVSIIPTLKFLDGASIR